MTDTQEKPLSDAELVEKWLRITCRDGIIYAGHIELPLKEIRQILYCARKGATDTQEKPLSDALDEFASANYELGYADARKRFDASFDPLIYKARAKELIEKRKAASEALARKGAAAEGLEKVAEEAKQVFYGYGKHHSAKPNATESDLEKAKRNFEMAYEIEKALAAYRKEGV